jgi:hypothetical protein
MGYENATRLKIVQVEYFKLVLKVNGLCNLENHRSSLRSERLVDMTRPSEKLLKMSDCCIVKATY